MDQQSQIQQSILDELGLSNLPKDKQEELIIKMTEIILKRIFMETMEQLDEEERKNYEDLVNNQASPEQLESFFREKIQNYDKMVEGVINDFKEEMKAEA
jgi:hypothetical protein